MPFASQNNDVDRTREELSMLKKAEKESRKQIASLTKDVGRLEALVADKPDAPDYTEIGAKNVCPPSLHSRADRQAPVAHASHALHHRPSSGPSVRRS